ncbi:MAG: serine/threonine protein kinase [Pseudomonadota bacterium]
MGKQLLIAITVLSLATGCDSGDIVISPSTADNSVDNSTNNSNNTTQAPTVAVNPCASYTNSGGQMIQGTFDGLDCEYAPSFVDVGNNLSTDLTIPFLPDGGAHIFQGALFVGTSTDTDAGLAALGVSQGGDGPLLTVEAGATVAFADETGFIQINRGSQIFAVGTESAPITFTSQTDVDSMREVAAGNAPTLAYNAITQWGGIVINGFGIVNNSCDYTGTITDNGDGTFNDSGVTLASPCHIRAEGSEGPSTSHFGGDNNDDSSGRLEYVRVKHTGGQVVEGDDLNGIAFGGVGRNTTIENLQIYSTFDDGIEFFGGAVDVTNFVALYVRDDSIDVDNGYKGRITNALVIQDATTGAHCMESDGIGRYSGLPAMGAGSTADLIARNLHSQAQITNLTCILSGEDAASNPPHDRGTGWRIREAHMPDIDDTLVVMVGPDSPETNYCLRIQHDGLQGAQDGDLTFDSIIFSCADRTNGGSLPDATTVEAWAAANGAQWATVAGGEDPTTTADTDLVLLEGTPPIYSVPFAMMMVDGAAPTVAAPASGHVGAVLQTDDWTANWTYGIHPGSRAPDSEVDGGLWFE